MPVILGQFGSLTMCMVDVLNVGFDLNRYISICFVENLFSDNQYSTYES